MGPLISVVIPTYNQPALLLQTLESVFAQTFADFEVVIIDDGSTDDTLERLRRIITQQNMGIGGARNRGIEEARGKYIALLDHDDIWKPTKLQEQVEFMERTPDCIAATVRWAYSTQPERCIFDDTDIVDSRGIVPRPLGVFASGQNLFVSSALMLRREAIAGLRYATERGAIEDVPFQIRLMARGPIGLAGQGILMIQTMHASNSSSRADYYLRGLRYIRRLQRAGEFSGPDAQWDRELDEYLAVTAHLTIARQLAAGRRSEAFVEYLTEVGRLFRCGRWRFAAVVPFMLLAPRSTIRRRWDFPAEG
jgi:glycosyltransferase involved in cell wall biosynthesis